MGGSMSCLGLLIIWGPCMEDIIRLLSRRTSGCILMMIGVRGWSCREYMLICCFIRLSRDYAINVCYNLLLIKVIVY